MAFGSKMSQLDWQTASHESLHQPPLTYRKATDVSPPYRVETSKLTPSRLGTTGASSSLPQLPQAPTTSPSSYLPTGGLAPLSPRPFGSAQDMASVRPKEGKVKLDRQRGSTEDSGSWG